MEKLRIKSFLIEHRSRIQAGNCFISFSDSLDQHHTRVSLKNHEIVIQVDENVHRIATEKFFDINVKSFHSLLVSENFISFRFITANEKQFDEEVLTINDSSSKFQRIQVNVDVTGGRGFSVTCSNCDSLLTTDQEVSLRRILELPSSNLDVSEWFCHRHADEKLFDDSNCFDEATQQFQPKLGDSFYGPFCLLMNAQLFDKARLRVKRKLIHCKRCLQLLGEFNGQRIVKLWCESVKFNDRAFFGVASQISLIKRVIKNHLACESLMLVKLIFEASMPANEDKKVHVIVQVMDRNLQLLKLEEDSELVERRSIKVMYLKLRHDNDDDTRTLKYWQKDINVATFELSFKMLHALCEYLAAQSLLIPEVYRSNNSFQLSYIEFL